MLSVYTRHSQKCPHRDDIAWRRCRCPKWIQGNVRTAFRRRSALSAILGLFGTGWYLLTIWASFHNDADDPIEPARWVP